MIDPVVIDLQIRGIAEVGRAFDSVESRLVRFERQAANQSQKGGRERVRSAQTEARDREAAYKKLFDECARREKQQARETEREARRRDGIVRKSSEMAGRYAEQQAKAESRAAQDATRSIEREQERRLRSQRTSSEMAVRIAARAAAEEARAQEAAFNARGRAGRRIGGIMSRSVGGLVSGVGSFTSATLGIGGGMLMADAGRREMSAQQKAALLINAVTTGGKPPAGATMGAILGQAGQLSKEMGIDKTELVGAALEYSRNAKGGDFAGAMGNMGFFAKIAQTTGADINELAGSAGILQSQNPNLGASQMQQMMLDMYAQSKAGSLAMPEIAKMAGELGSTRSSYAGDETVNQRKLIALSQLARSEVASPEEAGVAIKDLSLEAGKHRRSTGGRRGLEEMGVKFNASGKMESVEQMVDAVFRDTKGDVTKIQDALGSQRATPLFRALSGSYDKAGGGEAGIAAVNAEMAKVTNATMTPADLEAQHQNIMNTPAEQMALTVNKIVETLEEALEPKLKSFADDTLPKLLSAFEFVIDEGSKFASWFADNPIHGIGDVILLKVTADLTKAGIGEGVKLVLMKLLQGAGGGGVPVPGGGGGVVPLPGAKNPGTLATIGTIAGGLTAGVAIGQALAPVIFDPLADAATFAEKKRLAKSTEGTNAASELLAKTRSKTVTPEDLAAAQKLATSLSKQEKEQTDYAGTMKTLAGLPIVGGLHEDEANAAAGAAKNTAMALESLTKAIGIAAGQVQALGTTASNANPNAPQRNGPR